MKFITVKISVFVCLSSLLSFYVFSQHKLQQVGYGSILELPIVEPSQVLTYGDSAEHFVEGWKNSSEENPDIVFIHGGCWLSDYDLSHARGLMSALSEQGYNVWSMEYRRTGETQGGWPMSLNDIQNGLDMLVKKEAIKIENTVVLGHSAGGHLALLLGASNASLKGVIGLAPIYDLPAYARGQNSCQKVTPLFMQGTPEERPIAYREANPAKTKLHANTVIFAGSVDNIVPIEQFTDNAITNLRIVDGAGHFDFIHPHSKAWYAISEYVNSL